MDPIEITDSTFDNEVVNSTHPVVVDFWAVWCGPCKSLNPVMKELASEYNGKAKIAKVDLDSNQQTAMKYGVRTLPTLLFFKNGKVVDQIVGNVQKRHIVSKLDMHLN